MFIFQLYFSLGVVVSSATLRSSTDFSEFVSCLMQNCWYVSILKSFLPFFHPPPPPPTYPRLHLSIPTRPPPPSHVLIPLYCPSSLFSLPSSAASSTPPSSPPYPFCSCTGQMDGCLFGDVRLPPPLFPLSSSAAWGGGVRGYRDESQWSMCSISGSISLS